MSKYNYKNQTLWEYCNEHNIAFSKVLYRIKKYLNDDKYGFLSIDDIVDMAMSDLDVSLSTKYRYEGIPLVKYCKDHNIDYHLVISRIKRLEKKKEYSLEKIIDIAVNKPVNSHYYKGELFINYCKRNNLNYRAIVYHFNKMKNDDKYKDLSDDQIIDLLKDGKFLATPTKYFYKGIGLKKYCKENNLNYDTIFSRYESISRNTSYSEFTMEQIIAFSVETSYKIEDCMAFKLKDSRENAIRALNYLSKNEVNFLSLRYRKNYTYDKLSKLYKVDENTIMSKEKRILEKLRELLISKNQKR